MKTIKSLQKLFYILRFSKASVYAASASYYLLLSVLPAVVFFLTVLSALSSRSGAALYILYRQISTVFPDGLLIDMAPLQSVSAICWLWSASRGIGGIVDGMDAVLDIAPRNGFLKRRLLSVIHFIVITAGLFIFFSAAILGVRISAKSVGRFNSFSFLIQNRYVFSLMLLTFLFSLLYKLHPGSHLPFRSCAAGALAAAAGWVVFSVLFSVYVQYFAASYRLYGILGSILLIAVWFRYCVLMLLIGIRISALQTIFRAKCRRDVQE